MDDLPEKDPKQDSTENKQKQSSSDSGFSRRDFLKISGISAAGPLVSKVGLFATEAEPVVRGPGKVPIALTINGQKYTAQLEPRVTLLDALRDEFGLTGAKRVCDRGACGACTVIMDGKTVYSCSILAIDAQSKQITTVESLREGDTLHPIQQAFVDNDAQQCGFCTPGFVMACKSLLDHHPNPTPEQVVTGLSGNFCRCGTYVGMRAAVKQAAAATKGA